MIDVRNSWKRAGEIVGLAVLLVLLTVVVSPALQVPKLQGRVNDYAHILSPGTVRQLDAALRYFEQTDSTQIVVLTVPSLKGEPIDDFGIHVADTWKIGQAKRDNGAILIISRMDRKVRIEVGYGLEGRLTDLVSGRIIRNVIVPAFRAGNFDEGVAAGVGAMMAAVKGEYKATSADRRAAGKRRSSSSGLFLPLIAFVFLVTQLGRLRRTLGTVAGGVLLPLFGAMFLGGGLLLLLLIPLGLVAGFLLSLLGGGLFSGTSLYGRRYMGGGYWGGGLGGGGFGGFGGGGFGGFSGGGGGFGGGGASGGW